MGSGTNRLSRNSAYKFAWGAPSTWQNGTRHAAFLRPGCDGMALLWMARRSKLIRERSSSVKRACSEVEAVDWRVLTQIVFPKTALFLAACRRVANIAIF